MCVGVSVGDLGTEVGQRVVEKRAAIRFLDGVELGAEVGELLNFLRLDGDQLLDGREVVLVVGQLVVAAGDTQKVERTV